MPDLIFPMILRGFLRSRWSWPFCGRPPASGARPHFSNGFARFPPLLSMPFTLQCRHIHIFHIMNTRDVWPRCARPNWTFNQIWIWNWILKGDSPRGILKADSQGGFLRGILKGDSQGGFSRGILQVDSPGGFSSWTCTVDSQESKSGESRSGSLEWDPGLDKISIKKGTCNLTIRPRSSVSSACLKAKQ